MPVLVERIKSTACSSDFKKTLTFWGTTTTFDELGFISTSNEFELPKCDSSNWLCDVDKILPIWSDGWAESMNKETEFMLKFSLENLKILFDDVTRINCWSRKPIAFGVSWPLWNCRQKLWKNQVKFEESTGCSKKLTSSATEFSQNAEIIMKNKTNIVIEFIFG